MDGIIIVNKEQNWTSNDVVQKVKRLTGKKVGHTGTLDPLATGVLPLLIGKGTLLSKYLINHDKTYIAKIKLGAKTDTADLEGNVILEEEVNSEIFDKEKINEALRSFIGKQKQTPPMYSAIKVRGKKLYEYARIGQEVDVPEREIEIYNIELLNFSKERSEIEYKVSCSKGTYIRSLCEDIAQRLGTIGFMEALNRTSVGIFKIEDAMTINQLQIGNINEKIITIESFFEDKKKILLSDKDLNLLLNGVKLHRDFEDGIYRIYSADIFIGVGTIKGGILKRDIIL